MAAVPPSDPTFPVHQALDQTRAQYDALTKSRAMFDHVREELDKLTTMGDVVSPEDVIGAAGRLVGHGIAAPAMAELLADMPTQSGQGLSAWIQARDADITQREMRLDQILAVTQHRLGMAGMRVLAAEHLHQHFQGQAQQMGIQAGQIGPQQQQQVQEPGMNQLQGGSPQSETT